MTEELRTQVNLGRRRGRLSPEDVRTIALFHCLPADAIRRLAAMGEWRLYRSLQEIGPIGPDGLEGLVVTVGRARLYTEVWGRELTVLLLGPGRLLNPLAWQDSVALTVDAQACDRRTIVYAFPSHTLREILLTEPTSASQVLAQLSEACTSLIEVLLDATFQDATTRVAHTLGRLAWREGCSSLHVTHQELAALTGLRREQVTRGLHQLRGEGYIAFQPHRRLIEVLDTGGLLGRDGRAVPCRANASAATPQVEGGAIT